MHTNVVIIEFSVHRTKYIVILEFSLQQTKIAQHKDHQAVTVVVTRFF
jgi:hypothetical protein